jgi:hypothetical protein
MGMIISAIIGLIAGAIGSLIAPWVNWGIEKKKIRLEERKIMLQHVRGELNKYNWNIVNFKNSVEYSMVKEYLDIDIVKLIDDCKSGNDSELKNEILNNITRIQHKWGLI